jgi:hypothetical protein
MSRKPNPIRIPESVVQRLQQHVEQTGKPLVRIPQSTDTSLLEAWGDRSGGYDLTTPPGAWEPPFYTYRGYAEYTGKDPREVMAYHGFEDEKDLDDQIDLDILEQMVSPSDEPGEEPWAYVEDLVECQIEMEGELKTVRLASRMDGGGPGSSYRSVYVSSPLHLSLLQHLLDEEGRGVRISVRR